VDEVFFRELFEILREKSVLFFQIEPLDDVKIPDTIRKNTRGVYKKFLTPHTRLIDLSSEKDILFKEMHEKGRYNIRLAERHGVFIERVSCDVGTLDIWMQLLSETTKRDDFSANSRSYYQSFLTELEAS
jgi:lipid II:glycine glycyltransferase (peptidoglycan interpeptide bridge formation enzyme)